MEWGQRHGRFSNLFLCLHSIAPSFEGFARFFAGFGGIELSRPGKAGVLLPKVAWPSPAGTTENSPAIDRWGGRSPRAQSPAGTKEILAPPERRVQRFCRPCGTGPAPPPNPAMNRCMCLAPSLAFVAQVSNLLYRRFPIGRAAPIQAPQKARSARRLETRDTVPTCREKSALR